MAFFLIFDILCIPASLAMSILVFLALTFWGPVNQYLEGNNEYCINHPLDPYDIRKCVCSSANNVWTLCK